jgi:hypothetical protein
MTRTFSEQIAHLKSMADLEAGERVIVTGTGRTGVAMTKPVRHMGVKVRWDEPMFGVTEGWVSVPLLDRFTPWEEENDGKTRPPRPDTGRGQLLPEGGTT